MLVLNGGGYNWWVGQIRDKCSSISGVHMEGQVKYWYFSRTFSTAAIAKG
jgi:hypothetical protein